MPQIFKDLYPKVRCIIDCSEIFTERPYAYQARAQTYSNYKKHNTVKFLVGITPCGAISFLSKCWGGRATDKFITMKAYLNMVTLYWLTGVLTYMTMLQYMGQSWKSPPSLEGKNNFHWMRWSILNDFQKSGFTLKE